MKPTTNNPGTSTRVSPHMARLWQMLNILFTIRSFEMKIAQTEESLRKCQEGTNKLLPTYTEPLRKQYEGAIATFKSRIEEEEIAYNKLLNEMALLCVTDSAEQIALPKKRIVEYDDDIESAHHRNTCGGHATY
jgi:hypothetical protein